MDAFQASASAVALVELCVRTAKFIRDVHKNARSAIAQLDTLLNEINSLQNISKLVSDLEDVFQDLSTQLTPRHAQSLRDLNQGTSIVIEECKVFVKEAAAVVDQIRAVTSSANPSRIDAARTVWRHHDRKDDIIRLRHNIHAGQSRLHAFYTALSIIQAQGTATSMKGMSDDIRKLGFQLRQQFAQAVALGGIPASGGGLSPVANLLGSVRLNKHFDVPRSVDSFFTGRQSLLEELKDAFDESRPISTVTPRIFVVCGFPGSGKTDFAFKFAELYRESFWGVFVMQADSHALMVSSFKRIVQFTEKKIEPNMAAAKHWLANQELPWLLIIDNADSPDLDMRSYFPASSSGCILVTSRNRDVKIHGNVGRRFFEFERLAHDEAKTVLLRAAGEPHPPSAYAETAASKISEELQCLPLALVSAGKTIRSKLCTWKSYLDWYRRSCDKISKRLHAADGQKEAEMSKLTVISALEPHFTRLEELHDETSIDALELIHTLGYFHHRNISFRLLKLVAKNANRIGLATDNDAEHKLSSLSAKSLKARTLETIIRVTSGLKTLPDVLRNTGHHSLDEHRLRAALSKLDTLNLLRCDDKDVKEAGNDFRTRSPGRRRSAAGDENDTSSDSDERIHTYSLHPLVHSWVRQRHANLWERAVWCEAANVALAQCVVLEAEAFIGSKSLYLDARELLPHITYARSCKADIAEQQRVKRESDTRWSRKLLRHLYLIPNGPSWLTEINEALRAVKYSLVYTQCGDFQTAADLQNAVRNFVVARRGMDDQVSIHITLALASTMQRLTEFGKAADLQDEVVQACTNVYGTDHPQTLTMIDQRGLLLQYQGRLHDCILAHQAAFDGFKKLGAAYRRQALIAQAHIGAVHTKYLRFEEAKRLCQDSITGLQDLNPDDEEILWAMEALSLAYGELNDGLKAYELMKTVRNRRTDIHGKQHPFTLWAAVNESRALWKMKSYEAALKLLDEPREIAKITLGTRHFGYLAGETLRACIFKDQGKYNEAQELLTDVDHTYDKIKEERGTDHADRILALGYQFELHEAQGLYREALETGKRILEYLRSINKTGRGWQHPFRPRVEKKMSELQALYDSEIVQAALAPDLAPDEELRRRRSVTPSSRRGVSPGADLMNFQED